MTEIKGFGRAFSNEVIAQTVTDESREQLKFGRLINKISLEEETEYYSYFEPEMSFEEAMEKGKLGELKTLAPGADFQEITFRDFEAKTMTFKTHAVKLVLQTSKLKQFPIQMQSIIQEAGRLFGNKIEENLVKLYKEKAGVNYNQATNDDYADFIIKAQGKMKNANLNTLAVHNDNFTDIRLFMKDQKIPIEPIDDMKTYFGLNNFKLEGAGIIEGGNDNFDKKDVLGLDVNNDACKVLYSSFDDMTTAPLTTETSAAFSPVVGIKIDDTRLKQKPAKYDVFLCCQYGLLFNEPKKAFYGQFKT